MSGRVALRALSLAEGISLLLLLLVAMPLKHALGWAVAARVAGSVHGLLFLALLSCAFRVWAEQALSRRRVLAVVGWALVPLGFVFAERLIKGDATTEPDAISREVP
jgi:integral membrane protein